MGKNNDRISDLKKELEELKRERAQLDVSLKTVRKEMADQTEAAGRDEAELLRQIGALSGATRKFDA